jgi:hypothetical protein
MGKARLKLIAEPDLAEAIAARDKAEREAKAARARMEESQADAGIPGTQANSKFARAFEQMESSEQAVRTANETVARLREDSVTPHERRRAVAEAIADANRIGATVTKKRAAIARAGEMVEAAERELEIATAAIDKAKEADARAVARAATSKTGSPPASKTSLARTAEAAARDDLEAKRSGLATLNSELAVLEIEYQAADKGLTHAIDKMVGSSPKVSELLESARSTQAALIGHRVALHYLLANNLLAEPQKSAALNLLDEPMPMRPGAGAIAWDRHPAADSWRKYRDRLRVDADADAPAPTEPK